LRLRRKSKGKSKAEYKQEGGKAAHGGTRTNNGGKVGRGESRPQVETRLAIDWENRTGKTMA
jgi:hypothetical protein